MYAGIRHILRMYCLCVYIHTTRTHARSYTHISSIRAHGTYINITFQHASYIRKHAHTNICIRIMYDIYTRATLLVGAYDWSHIGAHDE